MSSAPEVISAVSFHGLPAVELHGPQGATALITLQGAQVLSWVPAQHAEQLYLSERSDFSGNAPIRGGVPVCFPQFSSQGPLPKHGLVRCVTWQSLSQHTDAAGTRVVLGTADSEATRELWPHAFQLTLCATLSAHALSMTLRAENSGTEAFSFTSALHTYLRVADIESTHVFGLGGLSFRDAAHGNRTDTQDTLQLTFAGETDRVYHASPALNVDVGDGATLSIRAEGFHDTVVWNPGAALCARLADMPADGYRHMLCIEAACADTSVTLDPGQSWTGSQHLQVPATLPASSN